MLVDDVSTTGATLDACADVLKAGGAREVRALTVARAVLGHARRVPRRSLTGRDDGQAAFHRERAET